LVVIIDIGKTLSELRRPIVDRAGGSAPRMHRWTSACRLRSRSRGLKQTSQ
jgi:hypothetical protein